MTNKTMANMTIWEFMSQSLDDTSYRNQVEQIALSLVFIIYTVVGILGNALVLVSIMKIRHWSGLEKAMMCFLTNLAISDFMLSLVTFPVTAISAAHNTWVLGDTVCWVVGFAVSYLRIVSVLFTMWIGVHRALVIKYPFSTKITKNIARAISVGIWVVATVPQLTCFVGISPMHYDPDRAVCLASMISENMLPVMIYVLVYIVIPMGTIISVYSLLLYIAINAVRRTKNLSELHDKDKGGTPKKGMSVTHRRAFGTVFAQIGGFLLCFLPFVIFVGLSSIDKNIIPKRLQVYGACSSSMSAIINPLIYMNTNKTFKKFVVNLLKCNRSGASSTGMVSQTFRNPTTIAEQKANRERGPVVMYGTATKQSCLVNINKNGFRPRAISETTMGATSKPDFLTPAGYCTSNGSIVKRSRLGTHLGDQCIDMEGGPTSVLTLPVPSSLTRAKSEGSLDQVPVTSSPAVGCDVILAARSLVQLENGRSRSSSKEQIKRIVQFATCKTRDKNDEVSLVNETSCTSCTEEKHVYDMIDNDQISSFELSVSSDNDDLVCKDHEDMGIVCSPRVSRSERTMSDC